MRVRVGTNNTHIYNINYVLYMYIVYNMYYTNIYIYIIIYSLRVPMYI